MKAGLYFRTKFSFKDFIIESTRDHVEPLDEELSGSNIMYEASLDHIFWPYLNSLN